MPIIFYICKSNQSFAKTKIELWIIFEFYCIWCSFHWLPVIRKGRAWSKGWTRLRNWWSRTRIRHLLFLRLFRQVKWMKLNWQNIIYCVPSSTRIKTFLIPLISRLGRRHLIMRNTVMNIKNLKYIIILPV